MEVQYINRSEACLSSILFLIGGGIISKYKRIKNFPDYLISSDGLSILKSTKDGIQDIGIWDNGFGYKATKLTNESGRRNLYIHRLVYETFIGAIPEKMEINHIDHNKSNNSFTNLEVVSHSENMVKMREFYGLPTKPVCKKCSKKMYMEDSDLCIDCLPINKRTGKRIRTEKEVAASSKNRKVERPDAETLLKLIQTTSFTEIGRMYDVSDNSVRNWCRGYGLPFRKKDIEEYNKQIH